MRLGGVCLQLSSLEPAPPPPACTPQLSSQDLLPHWRGPCSICREESVSQQASGPLVIGQGSICSSCAVSGGPLLVWAAVLPLDGPLLPGLRGCGPLRVSPFPRPSSRQRPLVGSSRLTRENFKLVCTWGHLYSGCRCPRSATENFVLPVWGSISLCICPSAIPCLLGSSPWGIALFISKY